MPVYINTPYYRGVARRRATEPVMDQDPDSERCQVMFPIDVKEIPDGYLIEAFLPGVTPEDLNVEIVNQTVTIQGEVKTAEENQEGAYLLQERPRGRFYRLLNLPEELDASKADASLRNGVLTLRIPKSEALRPRSIKVTPSKP